MGADLYSGNFTYNIVGDLKARTPRVRVVGRKDKDGNTVPTLYRAERSRTFSTRSTPSWAHCLPEISSHRGSG